ncbi:hypothetical protein KJ636_00265 [Patescibacteria group bacterium]|nr:hypothetical protein [Patescibacteria group bacterium]
MANQSATKTQELRQKIEKLEEEIQAIKWDISVPKVLKRSIIDLSKGILGSKFEKGVEYQRRIRKEWERRMKKLGL